MMSLCAPSSTAAVLRSAPLPDDSYDEATRARLYTTLARLWSAAPTAAALRSLCAGAPLWQEDAALQSAWTALLYEARALQSQDIASEFDAVLGCATAAPLHDMAQRLAQGCEDMCGLILHQGARQAQTALVEALLPWATPLCQAVQRQARARFYAALAHATTALFKTERG